ncbi:MAG: DUF4440 domain-containing protein [Gammaproteobacteria bacterium]|nr:DUF4440 domain-containing protein [Gammaproteobacteria bacterium]
MTVLLKTIKELEEKLLHSDVRSNPELLDELLAQEFEEIESTGRLTSRREVVDWLLNKEVNTRWSLDAFRIKPLSEEVVLAVYVATKLNTENKKSKGSMRCSIWQRHGDNWKMIFHQGTNIEAR